MTPSSVPLVVPLQPAGSLQPCVLKPTELETDGKAAEEGQDVTRETDKGVRVVLAESGVFEWTRTGFSSEANAGVGRARHFGIAEAEAQQAVFAHVARQGVGWEREGRRHEVQRSEGCRFEAVSNRLSLRDSFSSTAAQQHNSTRSSFPDILPAANIASATMTPLRIFAISSGLSGKQAAPTR